MKNTELLNDLNNYMENFRSEDTVSTKKSKYKYSLKSIAFTYGSTPQKTFQSLLNNLKIKPKRLVVVGSSIGWINFYWNELYPNVETIGIDIHSFRVNFAKKMVDKFNLKNITFSETSFYDFEFSEGDLIWQSNLCFNAKDVYNANEDLLKKTPKVSIISYRPISKNKDQRKYITPHYYPVSWMEKQSFYIYEKI
tara:strand:- start:767 stop:1351 length:585 start_codon:yes stop_codon:yes gene_type:complete